MTPAGSSRQFRPSVNTGYPFGMNSIFAGFLMPGSHGVSFFCTLGPYLRRSGLKRLIFTISGS
jgi:hypothetical protein